jgi:hypothetical protein
VAVHQLLICCLWWLITGRDFRSTRGFNLHPLEPPTSENEGDITNIDTVVFVVTSMTLASHIPFPFVHSYAQSHSLITTCVVWDHHARMRRRESASGHTVCLSLARTIGVFHGVCVKRGGPVGWVIESQPWVSTSFNRFALGIERGPCTA